MQGREITKRESVQLTIDTQTHTYEQAIAAVQATYGFNPAAAVGDWPERISAIVSRVISNRNRTAS